MSIANGAASPALDGRRKHVYSSYGLGADKRRDWQDLVADLYGPLDVDLAHGGTGFRGEIHFSTIGRTELTEIRTDGEVARRKKQHISKDERDFFLFGLGLSGTARYEQYGRECELGARHFGLIHSGSPYHFSHEESISQVCLSIPRVALESRVGDAHSFCSRERPVLPGLPTLLADLLVSLARQANEINDASAPIVEANLLDMIGLYFDGCRERTMVSGTAVRWALHRRAVDHLTEALSRPELTPDLIAAALGISTRYLHRVFEDAQDTVAETLMRMRLDRCRDHLIDPSKRPVSIKEIAYKSGFKSQSHFASAFKGKFGMSPRDLRQAAFASLN